MNEIDVEAYMTEDQLEINGYIRDELSRSDKLDPCVLEKVGIRLRRHIFIEETVLFSILPDSSRDDVEYLEREHGKILTALSSLEKLEGEEARKEALSEIYNLLLEHNSYEESFVYGHFLSKDVVEIRNMALPLTQWKSRFESDLL